MTQSMASMNLALPSVGALLPSSLPFSLSNTQKTQDYDIRNRHLISLNFPKKRMSLENRRRIGVLNGLLAILVVSCSSFCFASLSSKA